MDINLTLQDRLNLYNQYTILQKLSLLQGDEDEAKSYGQLAEIVLEGYQHDYHMLTEFFNEDFSHEEAELVWDTLNMYSVIYLSFEKIQNPKLSKEQIKFEGFDGNNETRSMAYCRFIIDELGRFTSLKEDGYNDYNSHCRRCDKYSSMVAKWKGMDNPFEMSEEQIEELITTW